MGTRALGSCVKLMKGFVLGQARSAPWQRRGQRRGIEHAAFANVLHGNTAAAAPVVLVQGSSRGLGLECCNQLLSQSACSVVATCRSPDSAAALQQLKAQWPERLEIVRMDVTDVASIEAAVQHVSAVHNHLDVLFNVTGVLHIPGRMAPETALSRITQDNMLLSFQTNAMGPILVCQHFAPLLDAARKASGANDARPAVVANMSARVGSIGDNSLGGWYSYRASKAALNQLTKTMSLEFKRRSQKIACVLLHPGTCDTDLSMPFQANVKPEKLFTRERGAAQLLALIDGMSMEKTGSYLAWDGSPIVW